MKYFPLCLLLSLNAMAATYQVPVPAELKDYATWDIGENAGARLNGDTLSVGYHLPSDIAGDVGFQFSGKVTPTSSFVAVSGKGVTGNCMFSKEKPLVCMLKYPRLQIDEDAVDTSIASHFSGDEADFRKRVARLFSADPAGLLTVELR